MLKRYFDGLAAGVDRVNVLRQGGDDLVQLDYSDLLTKILELLRN